MFSDEFTCLLLYLSWNVLICNLHLKNIIHPKDSSPMMRFSNSHFCVQMVTVIKNEHFFEKKERRRCFWLFNHETIGNIWDDSGKIKSFFSPLFFIFPIFFLDAQKFKDFYMDWLQKKFFRENWKKKLPPLWPRKPNHLIWQQNATKLLPIWHSGWHTWRTLLCLPSGNDWAKAKRPFFLFFVWKTTIDRRKWR